MLPTCFLPLKLSSLFSSLFLLTVDPNIANSFYFWFIFWRNGLNWNYFVQCAVAGIPVCIPSAHANSVPFHVGRTCISRTPRVDWELANTAGTTKLGFVQRPTSSFTTAYRLRWLIKLSFNIPSSSRQHRALSASLNCEVCETKYSCKRHELRRSLVWGHTLKAYRGEMKGALNLA